MLGVISEGEQLSEGELTSFANLISPVMMISNLHLRSILQQCNQMNVVYGVAKAIGRMHPDHNDSRFPT